MKKKKKENDQIRKNDQAENYLCDRYVYPFFKIVFYMHHFSFLFTYLFWHNTAAFLILNLVF